MRPARVIARVSAATGLLVAAVALIVVISSALESTGSDDPATQKQQSRIEQGGPTGQNGQGGRGPAVYVVQNGDTLIAISDQVGVSIDRIQELNPGIDPQNLLSGQRIRLR